jgi:hypothetical protein
VDRHGQHQYIGQRVPCQAILGGVSTCAREVCASQEGIGTCGARGAPVKPVPGGGESRGHRAEGRCQRAEGRGHHRAAAQCRLARVPGRRPVSPQEMGFPGRGGLPIRRLSGRGPRAASALVSAVLVRTAVCFPVSVRTCVCLSLSVSLCLSLSLSVSLCLSLSLSLCLPVSSCASLCLPVFLCANLCLSVCLCGLFLVAYLGPPSPQK